MKTSIGSEPPADEILTRLPVTVSNRFLTVPSARIYMCLADIDDYRKSVILSSAPSSSSSFVVDHDLTIPQMGSDNLQNLCGFMFYVYWRKPRIYNPTTRQLVTLPFPTKSDTNIAPEEGEPIRVVSYYFGHDQYKVVCSICECFESEEKIVSEHWIFVVKAGGSWKKVAPTPQGFCPHVPVNTGLCIDGVIYYMGYIDIDLYNYVLVSFHVRSEEFKMIRVPRRSGDKLLHRVSDIVKKEGEY